VIILFLPLVIAQDYFSTGLSEGGFKENNPYIGAGFGANVNAYSGNLVISATDTSLAGRGISASISRTYNSNIWKEPDLEKETKWKYHKWLGYGWTMGLGRIVIPNDGRSGYEGRIYLEEPDGSTLTFINNSIDGSVGFTYNDQYFTDVYMLPDFSRVMYIYSNYGGATCSLHSGYDSIVITRPDGTRYFFTHWVNHSTNKYLGPNGFGLDQKYVEVYPTLIVDTNNNFIRIKYYGDDGNENQLCNKDCGHSDGCHGESCCMYDSVNAMAGHEEYYNYKAELQTSRGSPFIKEISINEDPERKIKFYLTDSGSNLDWDTRLDYLEYPGIYGNKIRIDYEYGYNDYLTKVWIKDGNNPSTLLFPNPTVYSYRSDFLINMVESPIGGKVEYSYAPKLFDVNGIFQGINYEKKNVVTSYKIYKPEGGYITYEYNYEASDTPPAPRTFPTRTTTILGPVGDFGERTLTKTTFFVPGDDDLFVWKAGLINSTEIYDYQENKLLKRETNYYDVQKIGKPIIADNEVHDSMGLILPDTQIHRPLYTSKLEGIKTELFDPTTGDKKIFYTNYSDWDVYGSPTTFTNYGEIYSTEKNYYSGFFQPDWCTPYCGIDGFLQGTISLSDNTQDHKVVTKQTFLHDEKKAYRGLDNNNNYACPQNMIINKVTKTQTFDENNILITKSETDYAYKCDLYNTPNADTYTLCENEPIYPGDGWTGGCLSGTDMEYNFYDFHPSIKAQPVKQRVWQDTPESKWIETETKSDLFGNPRYVNDAYSNKIQIYYGGHIGTSLYNGYVFPTKIVAQMSDDLENPLSGYIGGGVKIFQIPDYWTGAKLKESFVDINDPKYTYNYEYDKLGRLKKIKNPGDGDYDYPAQEITYYDDHKSSNGVMILVKNRKEKREWFNAIFYYYDKLGRLKLTKQLTPLGWVQSTLEYDERGNQKRVSKPFVQPDEALHSTFKYDSLGRVKEVDPVEENPQSGVLTTEYGHNWIKTIDEIGNSTKSISDAFGRTIQVINSDLKSSYFTYNARGNLISTENPKNQVTTYVYNSLGQLLSMDNPDTGVLTNTYDKNGNIKTKTDAKGQTITNYYDSLNRIKKIAPYNGEPEILFTYDEYSRCYHGSGTGCGFNKLTTLTDGTGTTKYYYDNLGRLTKEIKIPIGTSIEFVTEYDYDFEDSKSTNLKKITTPNGKIIEYEYNEIGQLVKVKSEGVILAEYMYNPSGTIHYKYFDEGSGITAYNYNERDWLMGYHTQQDGSSIQFDVLYYDNVGNLIKKATTIPSSNQIKYSYDNLYRLKQVVPTNTYDNIPISFTYDDIGNRQTKNQQSYTYDYESGGDNNRLVSDGTYSYNYDSNGNLITKTSESQGTTIYQYNSLNQLVKVTLPEGVVEEYVYDHTGSRIKKINKEGSDKEITFYFYDAGGNVILEKYKGSNFCSAEDPYYIEFDATEEACDSGGPIGLDGCSCINEGCTNDWVSSCCNAQNSCIWGESCYLNGQIENIDGLGTHNALCYDGEWKDPDQSSSYCLSAGGSWILAGDSATAIGEYDNTLTSECCGDDTHEYDSGGRCCPSSYYTLNGNRCMYYGGGSSSGSSPMLNKDACDLPYYYCVGGNCYPGDSPDFC